MVQEGLCNESTKLETLECCVVHRQGNSYSDFCSLKLWSAVWYTDKETATQISAVCISWGRLIYMYVHVPTYMMHFKV